MSPLPEHATSQKAAQVVTITHRSEVINVDGEKETTMQEVIEDVKATVSHTSLSDPDTIEILPEPADHRGDSDEDDMVGIDISMEQMLMDMLSAGLQPRGPNNNKPSATAIKKGDPIRDAKKNIKK